jgi:hypothetical protein
MSRSLLGLLLLVAPTACVGVAKGTDPSGALRTSSASSRAASGIAGAVALAAINRAVTHECWAVCRPGLFCDHTTGLCVEQGTVQSPTRKHPLELVNANPPGREYELPSLSPCGADAGDCADAGGVDAYAR